MRNGRRITVIIPALNEADAIGRVIADIPAWVDEIIVSDNGSTDDTPRIAAEDGATVVSAAQRGYGTACLAALDRIASRGAKPDIVVFVDGDYSDFPGEMDHLVDPILANEADLVIGSRVLGDCQPGALTTTQRFGNGLATWLIRLIWGVRCTDLGPFRAIDYAMLQSLDMRDPNYGWTVEMQVKAAQRRLRMLERPVSYRPRIGVSKVSGTLRGVWGAGTKILWTIARAAVERRVQQPPIKPGNVAGASKSTQPELHVASNGRIATLAKGSQPAEVLVVFTKTPRPGAVKTRLIPALGEKGAADLHVRLARHAIATAAEAAADRRVLEVRYTGDSADAARAAFGQHTYVDQGAGDLGARMERTFDDHLARGVQRVVIIGTDCPDISRNTLDRAFAGLEQHDMVLGPAADGGYYLIGLRRAAPALFRDMIWGDEHVFNESLRRAEAAALRVAVLDTLHDIDRPDDLTRLPEELQPRTNCETASS